MRVAFVSLNREVLPDAVIPLGLLYVAASTPRRHEQVVWDLCFEPEPAAHLTSLCASWRPDVVAMGLRNIQNSDYSNVSANLDYYRRMVDAARAGAEGAVVVLGGAGFSVEPAGILASVGADFGLSGEGEATFPLLLEALESTAAGRGTLDGVPNLLYRNGDTVVQTNVTAPFVALDDIAWPDRRLIDPRYVSGFAIDSVQTKRGCPLECEYCTYPIIEGRSIRKRDPVKVVDELLAAREGNPQMRHVFIVDSVFNLPPSHAKAICREMTGRGFDLPWTCYVNPLGFDDELAELMVAAGCAGIEIGSDSGVDRVLLDLRKGFSTKDIRRAHDICVRAGLPDCHTFLVGTRGETMADVHATLDFVVDLDPFAAILMPWTDDVEALDPALATERRALRAQVLEVLATRGAEFPKWIIPALKVNFDPRLFRWLRATGQAGPLWQGIRRAEGTRRDQLRAALASSP